MFTTPPTFFPVFLFFRHTMRICFTGKFWSDSTFTGTGRCCWSQVCLHLLSVRSHLFFNHKTHVDWSINTYLVPDVWSRSRRWTPSRRRVTLWRCRKSGSFVSLRSSPPRGSDGRIALKEKHTKGKWTDFYFEFNVMVQCHSNHSCLNQSKEMMFTDALRSPYLLFIIGKCHSAAVCAQLTHTIVTQAAVGGARRSEHLAGEAVLELDHLLIDEYFLCAWRRPVAGVSSVVYRGEERISWTDQHLHPSFDMYWVKENIDPCLFKCRVSNTSNEEGGCCLAAVSERSLTESTYNHRLFRFFKLVDGCC